MNLRYKIMVATVLAVFCYLRCMGSITQNGEPILQNFFKETEIKNFLKETYSGKIAEFQDPVLQNKFNSNLSSTGGAELLRALIMALQMEAGLKPDGFFGPTTEKTCSELFPDMNQNVVKIVQASLYFNRFFIPSNLQPFGDDRDHFVHIASCFNEIDVPIDGILGESTANAVRYFQNFMRLQEADFVDIRTAKKIFCSKGSINWPTRGCDCAHQLNLEDVYALREAGYEIVARYLTSKPSTPEKQYLVKHLTKEEIGFILKANLRFTLFFQEGMNNLQHCTADQGKIDGEKAVNAARDLGIPKRATIYAVADDDVNPEKVLGYFSNMKGIIEAAGFTLGVYGSRAVCNFMFGKGISSFSYTASMSYLWDGNLAQPMPVNWAFSQSYPLAIRKVGNDSIDERFVVNPSRKFDLDKVEVSGIDRGIGREWYELNP